MIRTLVTPEHHYARVQAINRDIGVFVTAGLSAMVTVAEYVPPGTLDQNAFAHKLFEHIATWWNARYTVEQAGLKPDLRTSPATVKESLKIQFGLIVTDYCPLTNQRKARVESWSKYTKRQRADLITATLAWMASTGIPDLPDLPATEYATMREAQ